MAWCKTTGRWNRDAHDSPCSEIFSLWIHSATTETCGRLAIEPSMLTILVSVLQEGLRCIVFHLIRVTNRSQQSFSICRLHQYFYRLHFCFLVNSLTLHFYSYSFKLFQSTLLATGELLLSRPSLRLSYENIYIYFFLLEINFSFVCVLFWSVNIKNNFFK